MKISIVFWGFPLSPAGGYKVLFEYANELVKKGANIALYFCYSDSNRIKRFPLVIKKIVAFLFIDVLGIRWYELDPKIELHSVSVINDESIADADIVIATQVETSKDVLQLKDSKGKKYYFIQGYENWNVSEVQLKESYSFMKNIVVSEWLRKEIELYSSYPIYCVPNGINSLCFFDRQIHRKRHSVVFHYRSDPNKGAVNAFEILKLLKNQYSDLTVSMISSENVEFSLPDYITCYRNLSQEKVAFINNQSEVFLCTSIQEGFGLPGLEAMACGCAVVSTNYAGGMEYLVDGENALLADVGDVKKLVNHIITIFEDKELRDRLVSSGRKTAQERNIKESVDKLVSILKNE